MDSAKHFHMIGPHKTRGRRVPDWLRCIQCGLTTNNKKFQVCGRSSDPGGRICDKCFARIPENMANDCIGWLKHLNPNQMCQACNADTDMFLTCQLCNRYVCIKCTVPESYEIWGDTGADCIICISCCPPAARIRPKDAQNYCLLCLSDHTGDRMSWPCQQTDYVEIPLIEALRAGRKKFNESSTLISQTELPASQQTEELSRISAFPSLIFGEQVESPPESIINSSRINDLMSAEERQSDKNFELFQNAAEPSNTEANFSRSKASTSRASFEFTNARRENPPQGDITQKSSIGHTALAQPWYIFEKKIETLLNGTLLTLANATSKNSATLENLQNKVDKLIQNNNNKAVKFEDDSAGNQKWIQTNNKELADSKKSFEDSKQLNVGLMRNLLTEQASVLASELRKGNQSIEDIESSTSSAALTSSSHMRTDSFNSSQVSSALQLVEVLSKSGLTISDSNTENKSKQFFHNSRKKNNKRNNKKKE